MDKEILLLVVNQIKTSFAGIMRERIAEKLVDGKISEEELNVIIEEFLDAKINLTLKQE